LLHRQHLAAISGKVLDLNRHLTIQLGAGKFQVANLFGVVPRGGVDLDNALTLV